MDDMDIAHRFAYHPPTSEEVAELHAGVRHRCRELAKMLNTDLPEGREKSLAITKLEEVMLWANASIARGNAPDFPYAEH